MAKKIMFARSNVEGDFKKEIYCGDLDKNDYETKYKGHLTCIKGCPARIKFTERKNKISEVTGRSGENPSPDGFREVSDRQRFRTCAF